MSVSEKVAYLRGLMEGLDIDDDSKEGKLFAAIVDVLDEIATDMSDMDEDVAELADYIEEIDEDLGDLEEFVYDFDDDCCCDDDCDCCCHDECDCIEFTCPACGDDVCVDVDLIEDDGITSCPNCGEDIEFDIIEEEDED